VDFRKASAFEPSTYRELLEPCTAVVHTTGTLLEAPKYKSAVRAGSLGGLVSSFGQAWGLGAAGNPLEKRVPGEEGTYEYYNRDAGEFRQISEPSPDLTVCTKPCASWRPLRLDQDRQHLVHLSTYPRRIYFAH
jgi:hypothetical protein